MTLNTWRNYQLQTACNLQLFEIVVVNAKNSASLRVSLAQSRLRITNTGLVSLMAVMFPLVTFRSNKFVTISKIIRHSDFKSSD